MAFCSMSISPDIYRYTVIRLKGHPGNLRWSHFKTNVTFIVPKVDMVWETPNL